ncbi:hypothetical protein EZS27_020738 [termite gut metagenome]|uniref:Uncharacterized protein n=1 Tax=termite gut metagenome TaxID=433724 RepID=A0A5J4R9E5_9ZZZZ
MIIELKKIIDEINNTKMPTLVSEFCSHEELNSIAKKTEVILQNIYNEGNPLKINRKDIIEFFTPSNVYIKDGVDPYLKKWSSGKKELIDHLNICIKDLELKDKQRVLDSYIDVTLIEKMNLVSNSNFDLSKLIRYLEEINATYKEGNLLACILLLRATLNYIPPFLGNLLLLKL